MTIYAPASPEVEAAVLHAMTPVELTELADRIAERRPFYIGAFPLIDPPLLRLHERDAVCAALRRAAASKGSRP